MNNQTRRDFVQTIAILGGSVVAGCGGSDPVVDGGPRADGGPGGSDSGPTGSDSGPRPDGGPGGSDSGPRADGGPGGSDSGPTGSDSGPTGGGDCASEGGDISGNHGHALTVPSADVAAGVEMTYNIMGASGHNHTVTLTAANFATLAADGSVTVTSSTDSAHQHEVTVTCPAS